MRTELTKDESIRIIAESITEAYAIQHLTSHKDFKEKIVVDCSVLDEKEKSISGDNPVPTLHYTPRLDIPKGMEIREAWKVEDDTTSLEFYRKHKLVGLFRDLPGLPNEHEISHIQKKIDDM